MGTTTKIEWTDATWNPLRGCSMAKGSETTECLNCYAARLNARNLPELRSPTTGEPFARILPSGPRWTGKVEVIGKALLLLLKWRKPKRIFVNSQSDLFHEALPFEQIDLIFAVMALAHWHVFQVLTKRAERMLEWASRGEWAITDTTNKLVGKLDGGVKWHPRLTSRLPLPHVWFGVSTGNQSAANKRIPYLLNTPTAKRFISYEPALGPLNLTKLEFIQQGGSCDDRFFYNPLIGQAVAASGGFTIPRIDWVIAGGESGPGARPAHPDWFRSVQKQCADTGIPYFFKQWGSWAPASQVAMPAPITHAITPDGRVAQFTREDMVRVAPEVLAWEGLRKARSKKDAGALLDEVEYKAFPA